MRVAILGSKGIPGRHGVEVVVEETASRLAASGHEVTVFGYDWYMSGQDGICAGCALHPVEPMRNRYLEMPSAMRRSVAAVMDRRDDFDLVHMHSADPCLFAGRLTSVLPVAATSHGRGYRRTSVGVLRSLFSRLAEKSFISVPHAASCVSPADTAFYNESYPGAAVRYIPNGMPRLEGGREKDLEEWGLEKGGYVLFSAGRVLPSKGLHTLLDAWSSINPSLPLVVVGGASTGGEAYFSEQRERAPGNVIFTGFIDDGRLWSLYRYPSLAVFPSEAEAQSMTLLEFLALGLDVVYSDIPENTMVAEGIGRAFRCSSSESLATVMREALAGEPAHAPDRGRIEELVRKHDWDSIVREYIELYRKAVSLFERGR